MHFLKSTTAPLAPGVYAVDIAAKPPGNTYMIYAAVDETNLPAGFIQAVEGIGFRQILAKPYKHHDGKKIVDLHFQKAGTDIFEGWTAAEKAANLEAMGQIFTSLGIDFKPRVMTLAEAFR